MIKHTSVHEMVGMKSPATSVIEKATRNIASTSTTCSSKKEE